MAIFRPVLKEKKFTLEKELRLLETTMAGVGFILGAGIYVLIGAVAGSAGSAIWLSFLLAGIVAITSGLSYAELSSMYPTNESEYTYASKGLGKVFGFFSYVSVIIALTIGIAGVALGFGSYFGALTGVKSPQIIAGIFICFFALLNWYSIKKSVIFNFFCTILSILGLLIIVVLAVFNGETTDYFELPEGFFGIVRGASLIFFAYLGFEGIAKLSEETKNARKNIPLAILLSIGISTFVYILVALAAVSLLPWEVLAKSEAPLADVAAVVLGNKAFFFLTIIALLSTANTIVMGIMSSSRSFYGLGEISKKFKGLSKVGFRKTPTLAIVLTSLIALSFLLLGDISIVVGFTNFLIFLTFIIINISVILLRYNHPDTIRKFKIPFNIGKFPLFPLIGIFSSLFLLLNLDKINIIGGIFVSLLIFVTYYVLAIDKEDNS